MLSRIQKSLSSKPDQRSASKEEAVTLEECLTNPVTREKCLRRILDSAGLHVCQALGASPAQDVVVAPRAPEPFHGVAGVILDRDRTKVVATVMENGQIQKLSKPLLLPTELQVGHPNYAVQERDMHQAAQVELRREGEPEIEPGATKQNRPAVPPRPNRKVLPVSIPAPATTVPQAPPAPPRPNRKVLPASIPAPATTVPQSPQSPQSPPAPPAPPVINLSKPLMGGRMPVVTPATQVDARKLEKDVAVAPKMDVRHEANFQVALQESRAKMLQQKARRAAAQEQPYSQSLIRSGDTMIPVMKDQRTAPSDMMSVMRSKMDARRTQVATDDGDAQASDEWDE